MRKSKNNSVLVLGKATGVVLAAMAINATPTQAAALYWDGNDTTANADGGAGNWSTSTTNWDDALTGGNAVTWTNGSNTAVFGGTGGRVQLQQAVTAGPLQFDTGAYTIDLVNAAGTTAFDLTATGISGSPATIVNSAGSAKNFTLNLSADATWNGTIGAGGTHRLNFIKSGAATFNFSGTLQGNSATAVQVTDGTLRLNGTTTMSNTTGVSVKGTAKFDLSGNGVTIASLNTDAGTEVTSAAPATLTPDRNTFGASTINGLLTGSGLRLSVTRNAITLNLNNNNTFGGGTSLAQSGSGTQAVNVNHNNGLGTGAVSASSSNSSGIVNLNFTTAAPVIGSLSGTGANANLIAVTLGTTGVNTILSVGNLNTSTSFGGVIKDFSSTDIGSLKKNGTGTLTLGGTNTYTGDTTVSAGTLTLASTGQLKFLIGATGVNNTIAGSGTLNLDGSFLFDLTTAGTTVGNSWNLVDVNSLTETFNPSFSVLGFTEVSDVWSQVITPGVSKYEFSEGTGVLSVVAIPEPATVGLLGMGLMGLIGRRRRCA